MMKIRREDALDYHRQGRPGKIEVVPTKPVSSQRDLSLAYSPGVAEPCREIADDPSAVDLYTARGNLVAVVTNGSAVLGLGAIGPLASKPVMEGKAVLFKRYADIDVFDIEVDEQDPEKFVEVVAALEPTFGGINLEDIKAPDSFLIEEKLKERMRIPVFHDDQHGTAIISSAGLINAAQIQGHALENLRVVCLGAGAAAIACMHLWVRMGVRRENIVMTDRRGIIRDDRESSIEPYRAHFSQPKESPIRTLEDAFRGAHVMCGLSVGGMVTPEHLKLMADQPIIFAMANPDPEIDYETAKATRPDAVIGTGRSDYPNQVNNVLGFPFIFRGALDVGAKSINEEMKLAAAHALARLAKEGVPENVLRAYGGEPIRFGKDYVIPKPVDGRVLSWVAPAVAQAAMDSGVARIQIDVAEYAEQLTQRLSPSRRVMWSITSAAKASPKRIVLPEGEEERILRAAQIVADDKIGTPILIGRPSHIRSKADSMDLSLRGVEIVDLGELPKIEEYTEELWKLRARKGLTRVDARKKLERSRTHYGMMMLQNGHADCLLAGLTSTYPETIRPALRIIGVREGVQRAAGLYMMITNRGPIFLADTTINIDPSAETIAEIAMMSADLAKGLGIEPQVAMLSFSNFGSAPHPESEKMALATSIVKEKRPDLIVDGEMQADVALEDRARSHFPFCALKGRANVLIFPNLSAGNIAYKLIAAIEGAEVIGPLVLGMNKPVSVIQPTADVSTIVDMATVTIAL